MYIVGVQLEEDMLFAEQKNPPYGGGNGFFSLKPMRVTSHLVLDPSALASCPGSTGSVHRGRPWKVSKGPLEKSTLW